MKRSIVLAALCIVLTLAFMACNGNDVNTPEISDTKSADLTTSTLTTEVEISTVETEEPETELTTTDAEAVSTEETTSEVVTTEAITTEAVTTEPETTTPETEPTASSGGGGGGGTPPSGGGGGGGGIPPAPVDPCANGHDEEQHEAKAATCTEMGWDAYVTCKRDGCNYTTKGEDIPALNHDEEQHDAKAVACTEAGWDAYVTCKRNGCDYSTKVEIPASHDEEQHEAKAVTCTEAGWDAYVTCKREGCEYTTYVEIPASHDEEPHEAKAATCTEIGWEAYVTCKREGCEYTTYVEIPITHAYVSGLCSCGDIQEAINLEFESNGEGTCSVIGIGTCSANYIKIPETSPEGDAVTAIGENAFENCSNLKSIVIPTSVKDIEEQAFLNCNGLKKIEVPNSVTTIELGAFKNCGGLESITLPFVGRGSFYTNFGYIFGAAYSHSHSEVVPATLKTVIITGGGYIDYIGADAFEGCANIETIVLSEGITSISKEAFDGCNSLKTINIPDSVTSIGESAFRDCSSLEKIEIPARVTIIGQGAFIRCNKLESITIPNATTHLGQLFGVGNYTYNESNVPKSLKKVIITGGTEIADNVFYECSSITTIEIPSSVTNIGDSAFYGCSSLDTINYRGTKSQWNSVLKGDDWNYKAGESTTNGSCTVVYNYGSENPCIKSHSFTTYISDNNVTCLNDGTQTAVCDNCDAKDTVSVVGSALGHNLIVEKEAATVTCTTAGKTAVMGCERCEYTEGGVSVPELKHKFDEATGKCDNCGRTESKNLEFGYKDGSMYVKGIGTCTDTEIIIPSKYGTSAVTAIGDYAFDDCGEITSVYIPEGITKVGEGAFNFCYKLTNVELPSTITSIGHSAFPSYCKTEENGVYYVGNWAVFCNSSVTEAKLKDGTVGIADGGFYGCPRLKSVEIPESVKYIGNSAFYLCLSLENITIPESVISIGRGAFFDCNKIKETEDGVIYVDRWAIEFGNTGDVVLRSNTIGIANAAFYQDENLKTVAIPKSVRFINEGAFYQCPKLNSVTFEEFSELKTIGRIAFSDAKMLNKINYGGSEEQWNAIVKGENWDYKAGSSTSAGTYTIVYNYTTT